VWGGDVQPDSWTYTESRDRTAIKTVAKPDSLELRGEAPIHKLSQRIGALFWAGGKEAQVSNAR
jgi:hypothetical protein